MAKVDFIQTSFAAGEIGPALYGRTDVAQYSNACKIVQNFLVRSYGPVSSTPGTKYIYTASISTSNTRLIKFVFNRTDSYVIEMGEYYMRFYTNGGIVVTTGTTPFTLATVFSASEIADVQYTQQNDVIWLTHPDHAPQKLVRTAAASWTISAFAYTGGPYLDDNTTATTITPSGVTGTINLSASAGIFVVDDHDNTYWMIGGLALTSPTTGLQEVGYVKITDVINSTTATASVIKTLKAATATTNWAEAAWSDYRGWPGSVTFHERRLWFARTAEEPQKVWGSKTFEYDNFSLDDENDDDGLNLSLASNESNEIQWLTSGKSLLAGTYGGTFVINSGSSEPITPSNANASEQTGYGAAAITPKKIGGFLYYAQTFGQKIREMFYNFDTDTYKAVDRTILAPHILEDGVKEMDVQNNPETILWCVLTTGTIATMTREIDQDVTGWAKQITDGTYSSIAIIPSQTRSNDEVWVIVDRWIEGVRKKYIEVFDEMEPPDRQDLCNYLHSSLLYNAFTASTSSTVTISLSGTSGTVTVTSSGIAFAQSQVGNRLRAIDADGVIIGEGNITATVSTSVCTIAVTYTFDAQAYAVSRWGVSVDSVSGLDHLEGEEVNVLADGGTDLPTKTVATGAITLEYDYFVVRAGLAYNQIIRTLPRELGSIRGTSQGKIQRINEVGFKVDRSHKGFYVGGTETELDNVSYIEATTTEILYTGTIPNTDFILERVSFRDPATPLGTPEVLFTGIMPNISFRDDYQYGSEIYIKNVDPLPINLLSIIGTLDTFDK